MCDICKVTTALYYLNWKLGYDQNDTKIAPFDVLQIEKLRTQANEQEANLLAQEEEVHGKQRELDALKEEEKQLMDDIKASEKEIEKFEHDLEVALELNSEVSFLGVFRSNFDECCENYVIELGCCRSFPLLQINLTPLSWISIS